VAGKEIESMFSSSNHNTAVISFENLNKLISLLYTKILKYSLFQNIRTVDSGKTECEGGAV